MSGMSARDGDGSADLTVVVATYNGAAYIEEQLVSICEQTLRPRRIVVTDDGSTDDTVARATAVLARYPIEASVGRNPGARGYSNNFFNGVSQARSEYIAFCDQDDVWEPGKLALCMDALARPDVDMCAHGASLIDAEGRHIGTFRHGPGRSMVLEPGATRPWFTFAGFTIVFRASLLRLIAPDRRGRDFYRYHETLSHDSWITFLASATGRIAFLADPLVRYRQHGRNVVGARQENALRRLMLALGPAAHPALNRSAIARRWAARLREVARRDPAGETGDSAGQAAARWMRIAAVELSRQRMYARRSPLTRARALAVNVARGHYSRRAGGLGLRYIPKDVLVGVLRLKRPRV